MFLNADLLKTHPEWAPFVVAKLHAELSMDRGLDSTGVQKHFDALFGVIRVARNVMDSDELRVFLRELKQHERSGYFEWDEEAREFLEGGGSVEEAKRVYLERHHGNRWVSRGRFAEELTAMGFRHEIGFRNHGEAIAQKLSESPALLYSAALLVHQLTSLSPGFQGGLILLRPPFNTVAYQLTKEANGVADLVRFEDAEGLQRGEDVISVIGRRKTLIALGKKGFLII